MGGIPGEGLLGGMAGCCCPGKGLGPPGPLLGGAVPGPPGAGARPGNGPRGGIMFGAPGGGPYKMTKHCKMKQVFSQVW